MAQRTPRAPVTMTIRLTEALSVWLESTLAEGESRAGKVRRVLGEAMRKEQAEQGR